MPFKGLSKAFKGPLKASQGPVQGFGKQWENHQNLWGHQGNSYCWGPETHRPWTLECYSVGFLIEVKGFVRSHKAL